LDNVEDVKTRLDPYFSQVRENAQAKITTLNELLMSQAENLKDKLQTAAEDIKDRFEGTAKNLQSTVGEKMEELRNWFQPYVSMIRDNL